MNRLIGVALAVAFVSACVPRKDPGITPEVAPVNAVPCKGQKQGKNDKDCVITVEVTPPSTPTGECSVKVAADQDVTVFEFPRGDSKWIIWRLNSADYEFKPKGEGVVFKKRGAPFDDNGPRKGGSEYTAKNLGRTQDVFLHEEWAYGIQIASKQSGTPGCGFDPMIRNE